MANGSQTVKCVETYQGTEYTFTSPVPQDCICSVCLELLNSPIQTKACGHVFCKDCFNQAICKAPRHLCPVCRGNCSEEGFEDKKQDRLVKNLEVRCSHKREGCRWTGALCRLEDHLNSNTGCQFHLIPCSLECGVSVMRKDHENHRKEHCPRRTVTCQYCGWKGQWRDLKEHYLSCLKYPITCPYSCSVRPIHSQAMEAHLEKCKEQEVACPYSELGCKALVKRRLLAEHKESDKDQHHALTMDQVCKLTRIIKEASLDVSKEMVSAPWLRNTRSFPAMPWIVRFDGFQENIGIRCLSVPFYTAMVGYKVCLVIYAGGDGEKVRNHISVYTALHRGPHNSILTWPFKETVKVTLLNQLEDNFHHEETIDYADADSVCNEIAEGKQSATGLGCPKFIERSQLDKKQDQNCQYMKDNCLFFKLELV